MEKVKVSVGYCENNYGAGAVDFACIATGRTLEEVKSEIADALEFHFEAMREDNEPCPAVGDYELEFELSPSALMNHYKNIVPFSALSRVTGISQRILGHYATSYRTPRPEQYKKIIDGYHAIGAQLSAI